MNMSRTREVISEYSYGSRMKNIMGFTGALAILLAAGAAHAQVDRTKQPPAAPAPAASFPAYEEFTLKNGLRVFFVRDSRPLVTFRMLVRGGRSVDGDLPGLGEAAADLLTQGTTKRSAEQYADEIDFIGGGVSASVSDDAIEVIGGGLRSQTEALLDLFADAVKNPAYPAEELDKYKQEQISGLQAQMAQPSWLVTQAVNRLLYGGSAYGQVRTAPAIMGLTREKIRNYHDTYFVPGNAVMAVVGDFTPKELRANLESKLGDWAPGAVPTLARPDFPERTGRRIILIDRPAAVQSNIRVVAGGPLFNDPIRPKTSILASILGGGSTARLYMNLRETHGYTYGSYSFFDANLYSGRFIAQAEVRNSVTDSALAEMLHEIERIQKENVPREELDRTVQAAEGTFLLSVAEPNITAQRVLFIQQYDLPKNYYNNLLDVYRSVTPTDVKELARRYLNPDNLAIVVVGRASEIQSGLERFGTVEVWKAEQFGG